MTVSFDGEKLKRLLKKHNLTQAEFASSIEISKSMLSKIENGHKQPSIQLIAIIAEYFNVPIEHLIKEG